MNRNVCMLKKNYQGDSFKKSLKKVRSFISLRSVAVIAALGVIIPILVILSSVFQPESEIWQHIVETLLVDLLKNTIVLCAGVMVGTFLLGVGAAWINHVRP